MTLEMREREIGRMWEKKGFARGEAVGQKRGEEIGQKRGEEIGRKQGEEIGRKQGELTGRSLNQEENFLNALRNGVDPKLAQKIVAISDETAERLLNRFRSGKAD